MAVAECSEIEDGGPLTQSGDVNHDAHIAKLEAKLDVQSKRLQQLERQLRFLASGSKQERRAGSRSPRRRESFHSVGSSPSRSKQRGCEVLERQHSFNSSGGFEQQLQQGNPARKPDKCALSVGHGGRWDAKSEAAADFTAPPSKSGLPPPQCSARLGSADPFEAMWSEARFDNIEDIDQDHLLSLYNSPHAKVRRQAALVGGGALGILSMPFGPMGMVSGGLVGAVVGGLIGIVAEKRRWQVQLHHAEAQHKRLRSLIRWATERLNHDDDILCLLEMIVLEFKPMADLAEESRSARKLLRLLDRWISTKSVTRQLYAYMDVHVQQWRVLSRRDFMRSMMVFQILATMYSVVHRTLDEQEQRFIARMELILDHPSVKSVMDHAQKYPSEDYKRVMECMGYADAVMQQKRQGSRELVRPRCGSSQEFKDNIEDGEVSAEEEEESVGPVSHALCRHEVEDMSREGVKKVPHLKKPFFKSWDDFMDFDSHLKHHMPITLSEFELLLQKEAESTKGWDVPVDRDEIKVAKVQSGVGCITLRAWATVPNVDIHVAFYLFFDVAQRTKWDTAFGKMELIGNGIQGCEVLYSMLKVPAVTPRDFVQYRRVLQQEDGSILIVLRSAEHPDAPEDKRYIRAESHISGYILRQSVDEKSGKPVLKIFLMSCTDVKGLIPKWMINCLAPKKPGEWVDALNKAAVNYQKSNPGFQAELERLVKEHSRHLVYDYEPDDASLDMEATAVEDTKVEEPQAWDSSRSSAGGFSVILRPGREQKGLSPDEPRIPRGLFADNGDRADSGTESREPIMSV